jgi:spore germination cell wall hydrolase CwlJ-like protein
MLTDDELAITCIVDEAANQPHEGRVAVGIVILNRLALRYASDGTMVGTVLHKWAFSGFWAQMEHGVYTQTSFDLDDAEAEALMLYQTFTKERAWDDCELAWADAKAWRTDGTLSFTPGPQFQKLTKQTVLYYDAAIVHPAPAWATPQNQVAVIYDETFFQDSRFPAARVA